MRNKHIFSEDLLKAAVTVRNLEQAYNDLFDDWASRIPAMEPEAFWKHANRLRVLYNKEGRDCRGPTEAATKAVKEFLRQALNGGVESFSEATHFAISYNRYVENLKKACDEVQFGWNRLREGSEEDCERTFDEDIESDEYRGNVEELLDSLLMAGEEICDRLFGGGYFVSPEEIDIDRLEKDVRHAAPSSAERILHGCNQIGEELHDHAAEYFQLLSVSRYDELFPKKPHREGAKGMTTQEQIQQVAQKIVSSKEMLAGLRPYWWDGFAAHNVAEYFQLKTGEKPFQGLANNEWISAWWEVQKIVKPHVKEIIEKFGEFGKVQ